MHLRASVSGTGFLSKRMWLRQRAEEIEPSRAEPRRGEGKEDRRGEKRGGEGNASPLDPPLRAPTRTHAARHGSRQSRRASRRVECLASRALPFHSILALAFSEPLRAAPRRSSAAAVRRSSAMQCSAVCCAARSCSLYLLTPYPSLPCRCPALPRLPACLPSALLHAHSTLDLRRVAPRHLLNRYCALQFSRHSVSSPLYSSSSSSLCLCLQLGSSLSVNHSLRCFGTAGLFATTVLYIQYSTVYAYMRLRLQRNVRLRYICQLSQTVLTRFTIFRY